VPRNVSPEPDPLVESLEGEDVVSLIGFFDSGRTPEGEDEPTVRMHSDQDMQRWLEIPHDAVVHREQIDLGDGFIRSKVWVQREVMVEPMVSDDAFTEILAALEQAPLSTWNLIPETRLVAADLLGLIRSAREEGGSYP
jgi:hypothetical protein